MVTRAWRGTEGQGVEYRRVGTTGAVLGSKNLSEDTSAKCGDEPRRACADAILPR